MKTITFECETITPMFLGGADGRTPELRPPSIKGLMRFWWRAMNGHLSLKVLKEREAEIFGASDEKVGRSKFSIRILSDSLQTEEYPPVPHRNFKFNGISPNQKISILLSSQYKIIPECSDILKVSLILGGFGKRVRRGFGSVRILNVGNQSHNVEYKLENILKLVNDIGDNKYKIGTGDKIELKDNLTAQYPFLKGIQLGKEYDSWEELLKKVGEASHNHNIDSLGFAKGNKRLASPIYVSVLKNPNNKCLPIISTLNTVFEDRETIDYSEQNAFKGAIL
jgi:CRISPR-associated protein Cmr1